MLKINQVRTRVSIGSIPVLIAVLCAVSILVLATIQRTRERSIVGGLRALTAWYSAKLLHVDPDEL